VHTIWRHVRGWPRRGQIGFAVLIGVVAGTAISTATDGGRSARTSRNSTPASATSASTSPASTALPNTNPATTTVRPPTTTTVAPPTTKRPASALVPLAIASPSHEDTYDREADFGGFVAIEGCKDTRAVLLIRTSRAPVTFTSPRECTVKTGLWTDPWSGAETTVAHALQIDHTVPLANAWRSGAWAWTHDRRVAYANDLADTDHLAAILSHENESKGDDGPDTWKPPNHAAWCRYAFAWDHIAAKWNLSVTQAEWNALLVMSETCSP
jgi:hypothetical protein